MSNIGYKYELQKGSRKYICPGCKKKTFTPYVKTGTDIIVDIERYGICDRQNNCRYHKYPNSNDDWTPPPFVYTPPKPTDYVPIELVEDTFRNFNRNPFFLYLRKIFNLDTAYELQSKYLFGTAKGDGTIFWQFDSEKNVRTGKVMYYNKDTGKRLKDRASWYVHRKIKDDFELKQVFFGEHLVTNDKPVYLVESEKTAIIMSGFYPDVTWIASGGANMLNSYRLNRLPRLDYVYPDNSPDGKLWRLWEQKTSLFPNRQMDVSVDRAVNEGILKSGDDILDLELIKRGVGMKKKIDYKMLCDLLMISVYDGETPEQALERVGIKQDIIPPQEIISIKYHNGLLPWAKLQTNVKSLEDLRNKIITVLNKTINLTIFGAKSPYRELMSPLYNFYVYASNLDKRDGVYIEADKIANVAWYGELARKRLEAQTDKMFSNTPSKEKFDAITKKIQSIWGFTDVEMDMFRYFVCQSRHKGHNPSLNKSIYLWAKQKRTGKTTIARAIVAVLNGEDDLMKAGKYESTLPREMQYNAHEIPVATTSNASILDEALFVDSTRSYPQIKQMLTSADVQLNIKYKDPVHMEAKRYYIFTSNDNITQFIQDEEERRFFEIQLDRVPEQIAFEEIYEIWKEFCTNAEPEENWQEWYNSFEYVRGRASEEIDYYINQFRDDSNVLDLLNSMSQTYVTPPMIVKTMILGKATIKERTAVIGALDKLVGVPPPSRKSKYNRTDLIDAILDLRNGDSFEEVKVDNDIEVLPF